VSVLIVGRKLGNKRFSVEGLPIFPQNQGGKVMEGSYRLDGMTPEELTEVQRIHDVVMKALDKDIWQIARYMATRRDDQLFGETEFTLREKALQMGAQALEATVNDRKKRGTKAAASSALIAVKTRVSSDGGRGPS
jgi:hypothetical protein